MLGMASGKDATCFDRVWFKEAVEVADITFDYDTYLLTAAKAKALKQGAPPPLQPPQPQESQQPTHPIQLPQPPPKPTAVVWEGELKREQWNLFSLKVLTRLAQADNVEIKVQVQARLKEGQTTEPLNTALKELGIRKDSKKRRALPENRPLTSRQRGVPQPSTKTISGRSLGL
jgi:hypothetical protein